MSNTYEFDNISSRLERYEWDNVWWEQMDNDSAPRVLYIGDSISCATRIIATRVADNKILFDGVGTSKAVDNPYFHKTIKTFAKQQYDRCAVVFNNGLHGWHLDDTTDYKKYYEKTVKFLLKQFKGSPIFLLLTTAVTDEERNQRVIARNSAVLEVAKKYDLPVIDLYTIVDKNREFISGDGVHLYEAGYELLAKAIVKEIEKVVNK